MGSAVAYHLARRGLRVLGLDRHRPPHPHGSSHGESRIFRHAYYEGEQYVPLARRATRLWTELETDSGVRLLRTTGVLMVGAPGSGLIEGAAASAKRHGITHQHLSHEELRRTYPVLEPAPGQVGLLEPHAGILDPEACVTAHQEGARRAGAVLHLEEPLLGWSSAGGSVQVTTSTSTISTSTLVLAVGPWLPHLLPALPLVAERQVMLWFRPRAPVGRFAPDRFPAYLWETDSGELHYGIPDLGNGVKAARHHGGRTGEVDALEREISPADVLPVEAFLQRHIPEAAGEVTGGQVCRYTNAPGHRFLIDQPPEQAAVWVVSPCSGHGFKFASAIGEAVADSVVKGRRAAALEPFRIDPGYWEPTTRRA